MPSYKFVSELGRGGMGVVYRAVQEPLGREVALKMVLASVKNDADAYARFQREVHACVKLSHPRIIKLLDAGEVDGQPFYAMELLVGARPLSAVIESEGAMPPARALGIAVQLLDALDYVHAHDLLHRDIKPANIMSGPGARITLMDFGLVKDMNATALTREGMLVGTLRYLAPELLQSEAPSPASDIWAGE